MISERQGEQPQPNKRTGKISYSNAAYVVSKSAYMVAIDPKHQDFKKGERVAIVEASNTLPFFNEDDPHLFAEKFTVDLYEFTAKYRAKKKAPKEIVIDRVLSFSPNDNLTPEEALIIAKEAIEKVMGPLNDRICLLSVHQDTKHLHVHFLCSTVSKNGKVFNPTKEDKLWNKEMDRLEKKYDLVAVGSRTRAAKKKPSGNSHQYKKRTGELTLIEKHLQALDAAIEASKGDFNQFLAELAANNIVPIGNMTNPDNVRGCSFYMDGETFTGTTLGENYKWGALKEKIGFDVKNAVHSKALWDILQGYEKESKEECTVSTKNAPAPSGELYNDVETLLDEPPEETTALSKPRGTPKNIALYRCFKHEYQNGDITYYWKPRKNEAFREVDDNNSHRIITKNGLNKTVCKAMLQRAKELNWSVIQVTGSLEFIDNMVEIASKEGIKVVDENGIEIKPNAIEEKIGWDSLTEREQNRVTQLAQKKYKSTDVESINKVLPEFLKAKIKVKNLEGKHETKSKECEL